MKKIIVTALLLTFSFGFQSCVVKKVNRPQKVIIVKKAPRNHKVVIIKNKRYYKWGGKYYRKTRKGYVVVRI